MNKTKPQWNVLCLTVTGVKYDENQDKVSMHYIAIGGVSRVCVSCTTASNHSCSLLV